MKKYWSKSLLLIILAFPTVICAQKKRFYVGTYTQKTESKGIYICDLDTKTGEISMVNHVEAEEPSFLARNQKYLYAVNETGDATASLSAFEIEGDRLKFINKQATNGTYPCFVALAPNQQVALVANYGSGAVSVFDIEKNGAVSPVRQLIQHEGKGVDPKRQEGPHVHSTFFNKKGNEVFVQDLGLDEIEIYNVDSRNPASNYLSGTPAKIFTPAGSGPRHIAFDLSEKSMYVILEMTGEVAVYKRDGNDWIFVEKYGINPVSFNGQNGAAEIKTSPDGKFLYASNRGEANTIGVFKIKKDGRLEKAGNQHVMGIGPRNFNISPDGKFVLISNQKSGNIVVFNRDSKTGLLKDSGKQLQIPSPVCVIF